MCHRLFAKIMAKFTVNTHRRDPYKNFKFRVIIDGQAVPGMSKISGIHRITEAIAYRDGSDTSQPQMTPGATHFEPIVIERGVTHDPTFEDWANLVFNMGGDPAMSLKNYRKDIIIQLLNLQGTVVLSYHVFGCWIAEYEPITVLDAQNASIAIERIVLQHNGWERDKEVTEPQET